VSLFVLSPEIEYRDGVEVATGRSTKRPTLNTILRSSGSQKNCNKLGFTLLHMCCNLLKSSNSLMFCEFDSDNYKNMYLGIFF
jgi:hypothetical protein